MYKTLITKRGQELLAKAIIVDNQDGTHTIKNEVRLKEIRFSDYSGDIDENMSILPSIKHTQDITSKKTDPQNANTIIIETLIPANIGGFYIETFGIYTKEGELFALAKINSTYKPLLSENLATDLHIKLYLQVGNASNVVLSIDESVVLASREFVNESVSTLNESFNSSQRTQDAEIENLKQKIQNLDVYQKSETYTQAEVNNKIKEIADNNYQYVKEAISVRVGGSEQFQTIRQAIGYLLKYRFNSIPTKHKIILAESFSPVQEYFYYDDLSFIEITSENREIVINTTINNDYFYYFYYCKLPYFNQIKFKLIQENKTLFKFESSQGYLRECEFSAKKYCIDSINSALQVFATTLSSVESNVYLNQNSQAHFFNCVFKDSKNSIELTNISQASFNQCTFLNIKTQCFNITQASFVYFASNCTFNDVKKANIEVNNYTPEGFLCDMSVKSTSQNDINESILTELISQNTKLYNLANDLYKNQTPIGTILTYAGNVIPTNFLLCDGRELKKADYPELYSVINTIYGESSDRLSFKLPNLLNKSVLGASYNNLANTQALPVSKLQLQFDRSVTTITSKYGIENGRFTYTPTTNTEYFTNMLELNENDLASNKEQINLYYIIKVY